MRIIKILTFIICFCALQSGAQTLTATYVQMADSADRYMSQGRWLDAERVIVKALRHEPANKSNYLLWSNLGLVRTNMEDYDGALEAYNIGLISAPHSTVLLSNRARTYITKGDTEAAMTDLDTALALDSTLQWPRKMRGLLRTATGDLPGAVSDFAKYEESYGEDAAILEAEGDIATSRGDIDTAITRYRAAYKLEPDTSLLGKSLLTAYMFDRLDDMADDLTEGLKKYPRDGMLYLMRAMLNKSRFQTDAMEVDLKMSKEFGVDETLYNRLTATPNNSIITKKGAKN